MTVKKIIQREQIQTEFLGDIHPVLKRVFLSRNVRSSEELDYSLKHLLPFTELRNIDAAVNLVADSIESDKRMLIIADFDADGATSCALAVRGLSAMGANKVEYLVPNRFDYGYGLTPEIVEIATDLEPDLIITVDNGISSIDGVKLARQSGIDVLITDHHLPGPELPDATVILNPNQPDDLYPSKNLAGVGVMFNLLVALRRHLRDSGWFNNKQIPEPNLANYLDLVALGTVADVVPLDRNNRIMVSQGLARIRNGLCCEGIKALVKQSNRELKKIRSSDLGFALGPRLNAAGRLTDMSLGIDCLLSDDPNEAETMATELNRLNLERRQIQGDMQQQALSKLSLENLISDVPMGICLFDEDWHQGVVGILASKIKEQYHRPVIVFANESEQLIKGSARSINGIHIRDVLEAVSTRHPGVIEKFGGHAMAAGLTIAREKFELFNQLFLQQLESIVEPEQLNDTIFTDGSLEADDLSLLLAKHIEQAGPWGQAFPEPVFNGVFDIVDRRIVGDAHLKMNLKLENSSRIINAIAFNQTDEEWPEHIDKLNLAYRLNINDYNGRSQVQLCIEHLEFEQ